MCFGYALVGTWSAIHFYRNWKCFQAHSSLTRWFYFFYSYNRIINRTSLIMKCHDRESVPVFEPSYPSDAINVLERPRYNWVGPGFYKRFGSKKSAPWLILFGTQNLTLTICNLKRYRVFLNWPSCDIKTKQIKNKTKQNKTKQNKHKTKQNKTKQTPTQSQVKIMLQRVLSQLILTYARQYIHNIQADLSFSLWGLYCCVCCLCFVFCVLCFVLCVCVVCCCVFALCVVALYCCVCVCVFVCLCVCVCVFVLCVCVCVFVCLCLCGLLTGSNGNPNPIPIISHDPPFP